MSGPEADRPEACTHTDVTLVTRGLTVTASVERSDPAALVVRPVGEGTAARAVRPGDRVDVFWVSGFEERMLPAAVVALDGPDGDVTWALRRTGPATRSRRRRSVRARVELPVVLDRIGPRLRGSTVDLSEGGLKALVAGCGLPPEAGSPVLVTLQLEDGVVLELPGEVVWHAVHGPTWLMALRFPRVGDAEAETLRRRVFRALRDERVLIGE